MVIFTKSLLSQIIIINICPLLHPYESVLISAIHINNKKPNEYYTKFCKFEAHLDKLKGYPNRYDTNSIEGNLRVLIFVEKYLTFTISPDFAIWVFDWDSGTGTYLGNQLTHVTH
jgi:hypothetical protein